MRVLLLFAMLFLCAPRFASAIQFPSECAGCNYRCVQYIDSNGYVHTYCGLDYCTTCGGVYLAARSQYQSPYLIGQLRFFGENDKRQLAYALNQALGWAVNTDAFGIGPFPAGTYSGTVAEIAQQIAAAGRASVVVDEANHKLTFGLPYAE